MKNFKLSIPVDNTYNVASDTHRQNIVSMKESTMNKEIKKKGEKKIKTYRQVRRLDSK